jgi:hypothetical protein
MGGQGYGYGGGGGADVAPVAEEVRATCGSIDAGMDMAPEVAADRGGMVAEPVVEELVEFVIVMMHTDWAVVYFQ